MSKLLVYLASGVATWITEIEPALEWMWWGGRQEVLGRELADNIFFLILWASLNKEKITLLGAYILIKDPNVPIYLHFHEMHIIIILPYIWGNQV